MRKSFGKITRYDTPLTRIALLALILSVLGYKYLTPVEAQLSALAFTPEADSYVDAVNTTRNYGTSTQFRVDGSPSTVSYIRFNLAGIGTNINSATLRIYANSNQSVGFQVRPVINNTWSETGITYANAPGYETAVIGSSGPVATGNWYSVDITPLIAGNGQVSLALTTTSSTALSLGSRESANSPKLDITWTSNVTPPPPTIAPTEPPLITPTPTPVDPGTPFPSTPTPFVTIAPTATPTATPVTGTDPVIVAAGDIVCGAGTSSGAKCQYNETAAVIGQVNPNAVLLLGDNQYEQGSYSDFMNYYHPSWGQYKSITYPAVGNHDYLTSSAKGYFDYFNGVGVQTGPAGDRSKGYYAYDLGNWRMIALNTNCSKAGGCGSGSPQSNWLKAELAANRNKCVLAYAHHPMFSSGATPHNSGVDNLFKDLYNGAADVFLVGHDHNYERFKPSNPSGQFDAGGVTEFVVGTGGRNFTHLGSSGIKSNSAVFDDTTFGVLKMTLKPGGYDYEFVASADSARFNNGTFTDSGSANCTLQ